MSSQRWKLSAMMFLDIAVWGAWLPLLTGYMDGLKFNTEWEQPLVMGAFPLGAFAAMFFATQFVDRNFAAEKFLAFSMLVAGASMLALKWTVAFWPFFGLMLVHSLFYVPTISITNSIAFTHLREPQREFGLVRMWGTIGWIVVGLPFVFILANWEQIPTLGTVPLGEWWAAVQTHGKQGAASTEATSYIFLVSGGLALLLAFFSLALPHTPPRPPDPETIRRHGAERLAWLEALKLLRLPFILVLFVVTFLDAAVHAVYFFETNKFLEKAVGIPHHWVMPVMSSGQVAEIATMALLGFVLKRLGWRWTMILGILGHVVRFTVFALYPHPWAAVAVNLLHGICYAFFFATVYIFVDEFFPKDVRSTAQGLFNFLILGLGPFVGNFAAGQLEAAFTRDKVIDFRRLFLVPAAAGAGAALFLLLFFHPPEKAEKSMEKLPAEPAGGGEEGIYSAEREQGVFPSET
jgi:MFS family permease